MRVPTQDQIVFSSFVDKTIEELKSECLSRARGLGSPSKNQLYAIKMSTVLANEAIEQCLKTIKREYRSPDYEPFILYATDTVRRKIHSFEFERDLRLALLGELSVEKEKPQPPIETSSDVADSSSSKSDSPPSLD